MVSSVRSRLNVLVINVLIVTMVVGGSQALALVVTPQGGAYDHNGTPSALKFTVNGAGTRITSGAKVQGGFPCAPKTLITTEKIDIVDGSFSYKGPVVRKSGQPGARSAGRGRGRVATTSPAPCACARGIAGVASANLPRWRFCRLGRD